MSEVPPELDSLRLHNGIKLIEPEIKVIDFIVSGSESIELLFRSLPSLWQIGVFIKLIKGGKHGRIIDCLGLRKKEKIRMGYSSVGVVVQVYYSIKINTLTIRKRRDRGGYEKIGS